jgi:hypothetical protein
MNALPQNWQTKSFFPWNEKQKMFGVSDRTSGVAAEGWKEAPDAGKVLRLGLPDRRGDGAGHGDEEKDEERR